MGDVGNVQEFKAAWIELTTAYAQTGSSKAGLAAYTAGLDELVKRMQARRDALLAQTDPEAAFAIGLRESQAAFKANGGAIAEDTDGLKTYGEALKGVVDKATGLAALSGQLGDLAGAMQVAQAGIPQPPQIGTALSTDVAALPRVPGCRGENQPGAGAHDRTDGAKCRPPSPRQQSALLTTRRA